jgi:hypothetical protein
MSDSPVRYALRICTAVMAKSYDGPGQAGLRKFPAHLDIEAASLRVGVSVYLPPEAGRRPAVSLID